jgi:hypothetical protein
MIKEKEREYYSLGFGDVRKRKLGSTMWLGTCLFD